MCFICMMYIEREELRADSRHPVDYLNWAQHPPVVVIPEG